MKSRPRPARKGKSRGPTEANRPSRAEPSVRWIAAAGLQAGAAAGDSADTEERLAALEALVHVAGTDGVVERRAAVALGVAGHCAAVVLAASVLAGAVLAAVAELFQGRAGDALREGRLALLLRGAAGSDAEGGAREGAGGKQQAAGDAKQRAGEATEGGLTSRGGGSAGAIKMAVHKPSYNARPKVSPAPNQPTTASRCGEECALDTGFAQVVSARTETPPEHP